jgi:hypothetical protein
MAELSEFTSRTGKLNCSAEDVYTFVTDIRHFERFIPSGAFTGFRADADSCSFQVNPIGNVEIKLTEKLPHNKVLFHGNALQINNFFITLNISGTEMDKCETKILLNAELNPFMKMIASAPVKQLLEKLIGEMEKISDWKS